RIISFTANVDGSPVAEASNSSISPVQYSTNELPPELRMKNLLLGGLWFCSREAKIELYLVPITPTPALTIACILLWCVDSGARGAVQGIKSHSRYYSCNLCEVCGKYILGDVRFPLRGDAPRYRTHEGLKNLQIALARPDSEEDHSDGEDIPDNEHKRKDVE
ncbi:hypothetical protein FOCC_FOCC005341, partial [Frankliniella occidentalis]